MTSAEKEARLNDMMDIAMQFIDERRADRGFEMDDIMWGCNFQMFSIPIFDRRGDFSFDWNDELPVGTFSFWVMDRDAETWEQITQRLNQELEDFITETKRRIKWKKKCGHK